MEVVEKKEYPLRKECTRCFRKRTTVKFFRLLTSGYRQGMCTDCEREYERERWPSRSSRSRRNSGGTATRRRRTVAA